jgi:hypothetical protein
MIRGLAIMTVLSAILMSFNVAYAQQSLYESSNGDTAIFLGSQSGVALYNIGNSSVRFGYLHDTSGPKPIAWGFDIAGTIKGTSSTLLQDNVAAPGVSLRAGLVRKNLFFHLPPLPGPNAPPNFPCALCGDWLVFQVRYDRAQFYTLMSSTPPFPKPEKRNFDGFQAKVAYNQLRKSAAFDWLLGASIGVARSNNTDALKSLQFTDNLITNTATDQLILGTGPKTAYIGNYNVFAGVPINGDLIVYPHALSGLIGFDLFVRSNVGQDNRYGSPGIGAFLAKKGQPARPIGGITISYRDGKGQASIVVGWTF